MIFADPKFDKVYEDAPQISYLICGARRSGTTFLCDLLWKTDRLGKPFEYNLKTCRDIISERIPDGMSYIDFLKKMRTTPNGVFGIKEVVVAGAKDMVVDKTIYITRRNIVAQAISLAIAKQTLAFFSFQDKKREPVYNYNELMNNMAHLCWVKCSWEKFFSSRNITPLRIVYEEITETIVSEIADFIGVKLGNSTSLTTDMVVRQRTEINMEWEDRFRTELTSRGCSVAE